MVFVHFNNFTHNQLSGGTGSMTGGDASGGGFYFEGSTLQVSSCKFTQNSANGGDTKDSAIGANSGGAGNGGAMFIHQHSSYIRISTSVFEQNTAEGGKGWSEPSPYSPLQYGRGGMAFGGAIASWSVLLASAQSLIHINACKFTNNFAAGGYSYLNAGLGIGGAIWGDQLFVSSTEFIANLAANGGAIYALYLNSHHNVFTYNQARATTTNDAVGGAIFAFNATVTHSQFEGNMAVTEFSEGNAVGGAIHTDDCLSVLACTFNLNWALTTFTTAQGGAIAASDFTIIETTTFKNNTAAAFDISGVGQGGSLYLDIFGEQPSQLRLLSIHSSEASYGGGIYLRGTAAQAVEWYAVDVQHNLAIQAGGGVAFLPQIWYGGIIQPTICATCSVTNNKAGNYGPEVIGPYMSIVGVTSPVINPGLPFSASFTVLDFALNTVKEDGVGMELISSKDLLFQSGVWQNEQHMDEGTGEISFPAMTAWGDPGEPFMLNFTLTAEYMGDFGSPSRISISVPYQLDTCPAGHRLDNSSSYVACQQCPSGLYGFQSSCLPCPDDDYCAITPDTLDDTAPPAYLVEAGFWPSPRTNPVAILSCPYSTNEIIDGLPQSSCLPSLCNTDCGPDRLLNSAWMANEASSSPLDARTQRDRSHGSSESRLNTPNFWWAPQEGGKCKVDCGGNNCAMGHTGFLCSQCVCEANGCWYPANDQCHKCNYDWRPTVIVFSVAVVLFLFLKGTMLVILMAILSIAVAFLLFFDLISTLVPSIFGTAFIIFAEAQRGSSSGLIKSFVFYVQTVSVFVTPAVIPQQLSKVAYVSVLTQFRVVGLECLSKRLFGDPFQRFIFAMVLPIALLVLVCVLYWLCELLRMFKLLRALQDFDPFDHIPFFKSRLQTHGRTNSQFLLLQDDLGSESEEALATEPASSYRSDTDSSSWISAESDLMQARGPVIWRQYVQMMNWKVGRVALFLIFAAHFELCNRILEVFAPCINVPSEGFNYSSTYPWLVCSTKSGSTTFFTPSTTHGKMAIAGVLFGVLYIIGVPLGFGMLLYWKRQEIKAGDSSTGSWLGLLYNSYRPSLHYFELAWLFRRIVFAAAISVIPGNFASRLLAPCMILFVSLLIQRAYKPFISKSDNNMEVISLVTIIFAILANSIITSRSTALDTVAWRWLNFFIITLTLLAFLYKLFKPFLLFLRSPPKDD